VLTVDIHDNALTNEVWNYFGVAPKIKCYVVGGNEAKRLLIDTKAFDFAFIDGDHTYEGVKFDFDLVKHCGNVLFHDYDFSLCPGVKQFIDQLPSNEVEIRKPFALWTSPK
jgi:predicted O-methyltransferase YrrM